MLVKTLAPLHLCTSLCQQCSFSASTAGLSVPLELVRAHILPTEKDESSIRAVIASETSMLAGIDEHIFRMARLLNELRAHRETFRTHLDRKRTLLSPIRRLPPELTGRILETVIVDTLRQRRSRFLVKRHPLLRVCHRWRNIVLGMPHIWANITLFPYRDADWDHALADRVQISRPLSLHLTVIGTMEAVEAEARSQLKADPGSEARWQHFSDILNASSGRWRSVHFDLLCPPTPYEPDFSRMTTLYLRRTFRRSGSPSLALFENAPALVNVRIQDMLFAGLILPWQRLRRLTVCLHPGESTSKFREVLAQCVALEELACTAREKSTTPSPLITLPNLRCVTLRHSAPPLLSILQIPKIREVHLLSDAGRAPSRLPPQAIQHPFSYTRVDDPDLFSGRIGVAARNPSAPQANQPLAHHRRAFKQSPPVPGFDDDRRSKKRILSEIDQTRPALPHHRRRNQSLGRGRAIG